MTTLPNSYSAVDMALKIERLESAIARLEQRLEVETDRSDYFALKYEDLKKVLHAVELLDCSSVAIENSGSEGLPWEISVCEILEDGPRGWQNRRQYFGSTLLQALESLARKEVAS